jgi:hypothetical protein
LASFCNVPNQVVAFWATCFKNILICFKLSMEWLKIGIDWVIKNYEFFTWTFSTTCWIGCDAFVGITIGCLNSIINTTCSTSLTWMLSITWFRLGLGFSFRLPYVVIVWSSSPPPPPFHLNKFAPHAPLNEQPMTLK